MSHIDIDFRAVRLRKRLRPAEEAAMADHVEQLNESILELLRDNGGHAICFYPPGSRIYPYYPGLPQTALFPNKKP